MGAPFELTFVLIAVVLGGCRGCEEPATFQAPPIDPTIATNVADASAFLYSGSHPIQTGVAPGTIDRRRAAVLRGLVRGRDGGPIGGAVVDVVGHPELGRTSSRSDGMFDLVVNGGGRLVVRIAHSGHLPVHREIVAPWLQYAWVGDIVLTPLDPAVATVTMAMSTTQVARGSRITEGANSRQATLLFAPGTQAMATMPDGSMQPLPTLHVHATEYTSGSLGAAAMPAELPGNSAYTYAVELSIDETPNGVQFTQPVPFYIENFLGFPAGSSVPAGHYDREHTRWVPSSNGLVIKILDTPGGIAALDVDGSGTAASASLLSGLGITVAELESLARLYQPGDSLWRVPIQHFSPWDLNWGFSPPPDGQPPEGPPPSNDAPPDCEDESSGSIITCQDQVLGESLAIAGTAFSLSYRSDRVPGRLAAYTLSVPLSGANPPASLKRIDLEVSVAGQLVQKSFGPAAKQTTTFTWDGKDGYHRVVQGAQAATVRIGYVYDGVYQVTPRFGYNGNGVPITGDRARREMTLWRAWQGTVGPFDARGLGLGGWTLDVQHFYDPNGHVLYLGDGRRRTARSLGKVAVTVAGVGSGSPDGGPALNAMLGPAQGLAFADDGSLFVADTGGHKVYRIDPSGVISRFAGTGGLGFSGDGGAATAAQLNAPSSINFGPDGALYIADRDNHRIRRVGTDGIIETVAGDGSAADGGDGGPALLAHLHQPAGVAVAIDGRILIADTYNNRVRQIDAEGIIASLAGDGVQAFGGDGGPATQAQLALPHSVAVAADGTIYIADTSNFRIRRVSNSGIIETVAGTGTSGILGDGGPANQAQLGFPSCVAVGPEGTIYIADPVARRVRAVGADGLMVAVAGTGEVGDDGDGGPAVAARFLEPDALAIDRGGTLTVSDSFSHRIRRVGAALPGLSLADELIASADGRQLFVFSGTGRHLRTLDALTGMIVHEFQFDAANRLLAVSDGSGQVTRIQRGGDGAIQAIISPFGQRTSFGLDGNGYLNRIVDPASRTIVASYEGSGLLRTFTDGRNGQHQFTYDASSGRLAGDSDPAGGKKTLVRTGDAAVYAVSLTTRLGHMTTYSSTGDPDAAQAFITQSPDGLRSTHARAADWSYASTAADGTVTNTVLGPDPRFGMTAPLLLSRATSTPGGVLARVSRSRTVTLGDPTNPLTVLAATTALTRNGKTFSYDFDQASKRLTITSPSGRRSVETLDGQGRVISVDTPGLAPVSLTYDQSGRLASLAQGNRTTTWAYDPQGFLQTITDPLSRVVRFGHDAVGRVTVSTLTDGRTIALAYDANGNLTSVTPPGRPAHTFEYTPLDQLQRYTPPAVGTAAATSYQYNEDHQLTLVTGPDGTTLSLLYDGAGRLSQSVDSTGAKVFGYGATGQLETIATSAGEKLTYVSDGPLETAIRWEGAINGSVQRTYDVDFQLQSETVNATAPILFAYDNDGLLIGEGDLVLVRDPQNGLLQSTSLGGVSDSSMHNPFRELQTYRADFGAQPLVRLTLDRDALGRIAQKNETILGETHVSTYAYDAGGRLRDVTLDGASRAHYEYDSNGNRQSASSSGVTSMADYDAQDRLKSYGATRYAYTVAGEWESKTDASGVTRYAYDVYGNLRTVTLPDGRTLEYVVDGKNRRVGKRVNGTLVQGFLWRSELQIVAELDGSSGLVTRFVYGTKENVPDYMLKGGRSYRILSDWLGSVRLVVDSATGEIAQRLDYDEFGQVVRDTAPGFQPFGFAGGLYDVDSGLVRFGSRDYDPYTGRWTARDPLLFTSGDVNLYGYVSNDPINSIDPHGTEGDSFLPPPPPIPPGPDADSSTDPGSCFPASGDPNMLRQCVTACKAGGDALLAFCRSIPDPRIRFFCWGLELGSVTACIGWCWLHWGD